jgi:hypothetical protein
MMIAQNNLIELMIHALVVNLVYVLHNFLSYLFVVLPLSFIIIFAIQIVSIINNLFSLTTIFFMYL